jgi:two-component system, NarL family, nitrate/nitrite response regulator NarL
MRILIADDHDLLRETLLLFLQSQQGLEPLSARDLPEALKRIADSGPFDLVLLDYGMPGMNGLEGLKQALAAKGAARVALMSGTAPRDVAEAALALGAAGFLPKTLPAKTLANAVRFMAMGEQYAPVDFLTAPATEAAPPHPMASSLSARELQVLEGLCSGKSNKEIARDLGVMEPTVKLHVKTLYRKIGAANRTQAAMLAKDAGLF